MTEQLFYDIVFSEDDGGYYGQIYNRQGVDVDDTEVMNNISTVKHVVKTKHPDAVLVKVLA